MAAAGRATAQVGLVSWFQAVTARADVARQPGRIAVHEAIVGNVVSDDASRANHGPGADTKAR